MIKSTIYGIWFDKMLTSSFLAFKSKRQVYCSEFEFSLLYIVSSRSARRADSTNWSEKREETPKMCVIWVSLTRYCTTCRFSYNHSLRMKRIRQYLFMLIYVGIRMSSMLAILKVRVWVVSLLNLVFCKYHLQNNSVTLIVQ